MGLAPTAMEIISPAIYGWAKDNSKESEGVYALFLIDSNAVNGVWGEKGRLLVPVMNDWANGRNLIHRVLVWACVEDTPSGALTALHLQSGSAQFSVMLFREKKLRGHSAKQRKEHIPLRIPYISLRSEK